MKTNELTGAALDWAVAKCEGRSPQLGEIVRYPSTARQEHVSWSVYTDPPECDEFGLVAFEPSTNWAQGGPIIEWEKLGWFWDSGNEHWCAANPKATFCEDGPTPLIATMRCYVASKLGDEVEIPEELQ